MESNLLRTYERATAAALVLGPTLAVIGFVGVGLQSDPYGRYGVQVGAIGLFVMLASVALSYPLSTFRTLPFGLEMGEEYARLRYGSRLKAAAILLNLLWLLTLVGLTVALADRLGALQIRLSPQLGLRLAAIVSTAMVLGHAAAHFLSLRVERPRQIKFPYAAYHYLALGLSLLWPVFALTLLGRSYRLSEGVVFGPADAPVFLVAGAAFASLGLFVSRPLPNIFSIMREGRAEGSPHDYVSRAKSVLLPAFVAFAVLFVIVLFLLLAGIGSRGLRSPSQAAILILVIVALVVSVIASIRLARQEDVADLYRIKPSPETRTGRIILASSLGVGALLGLFGLVVLMGYRPLGLPSHRWVDVISFALLASFGPYGFYVNHRLNRIRRLEERFPDFLRDIAASHRGGLTLANSVQIASRGEYGELTPDIHKMADQLSWHIPFNEALTQMKDRVKTPLVERAATLIIEASRSGGNTTDVLMAAAHDAREIKNLENERRTTMMLYTIIIYVTFLVFLAVAAVLYGRFVPEIIKASEAARGLSTEGTGLGFTAPTRGEFRAFYFTAGLVQGIGNGLIGGLIQHARALAGLRHAFFMTLITYVTFTFLFQ